MKRLILTFFLLFSAAAATGQILSVEGPQGAVRQYGRADFTVTLRESGTIPISRRRRPWTWC